MEVQIKLTPENVESIIEAKGYTNADAISYKTLEKLQINNQGSTDGAYAMLPDHTIIKCYLIDDLGNYVKKNGSDGKVITLARICDQRCFYHNILYAVEVIEDGSNQNMEKGKFYSTRASDIIYPIQQGFQPE